MEIICHRINTIEELNKTPTQYGIEIDIRSNKNNLFISHEPFSSGADLTEWLSFYKHGTLILNVKEEGLEIRLLELMHNYKISNFFFLDQSFPFLLKTALSGEKRCSVRISDFESIDTAIKLAGRVEWIWVDTFKNFPLRFEAYKKLKNLGFKLCLVSPELHGGDIQEIRYLKSKLLVDKISPDAICTKFPIIWL